MRADTSTSMGSQLQADRENRSQREPTTNLTTWSPSFFRIAPRCTAPTDPFHPCPPIKAASARQIPARAPFDHLGERNLRLFEVQIIWGSDYIDFFLFSCELTLRWSKWWQSTALSASAAAHASAPWRIGALAKGWWAWLLLRRPFSMCIRAKSWFRMHSSTCACTDQRQKCEYHCNDVHMISGRDLSKRDVLHLLMPLVTWRACLFLRYCHIRNVRTGSETTYAHSKE